MALMTQQMDEISRAIGALQAGVKSVGDQMDSHNRAQTETHAKLAAKIDLLNTSVTTLVVEVKKTKEDVEKIQPQVAKLNAARNQVLGIVAVISVVSGFVFNWLKGLVT